MGKRTLLELHDERALVRWNDRLVSDCFRLWRRASRRGLSCHCFGFERIGVSPGVPFVIPPDQYPGPNQNAQRNSGDEPEADQVTDRSLGEIEEPGRLILVHAESWQTPQAIARIPQRATNAARPSLCSLGKLFRLLLHRERGGKSVGGRKIVQGPEPHGLAFLGDRAQQKR